METDCGCRNDNKVGPVFSNFLKVGKKADNLSSFTKTLSGKCMLDAKSLVGEEETGEG